jgi:hypothetical protein
VQPADVTNAGLCGEVARVAADEDPVTAIGSVVSPA